MEGVDEQLGAALFVENVGRIHEWEAHPEASRPYEKVDLLLAPVGEDDALPVEALDAGLGHDAAVHDVVEIDGAGSGMRLEQLVVGRRQAVAPMRADYDPQSPPVELAHHGTRHRPAAGEVDEGVRRLADHDLGKEIVAATHRMNRAHGVGGCSIENVDG